MQSPLLGDFNKDHSVDAADYVLWRKNLGDETNFAFWRENFGATQMTEVVSATVPEPAAGFLALVSLLGIGQTF